MHGVRTASLKYRGRSYNGHSLAVETKSYSAHILISMLDVEVHLVSDLGPLSSFYCLAEEEESGSQNDHQRHDNLL